jgi:Lon protease-like protein
VRQSANVTRWAYGDQVPDSAELIPLFPLDLVLMPGAPQELHLFEHRYRRMLTDAQDAAREAGGGVRAAFGIVSLQRGTETSDRQAVADVGTIGEIVQVQTYPDGTSDLLLVGSDRFRILAVDTELPYLRATVEFLDEVEGASDAELEDLGEMARELFQSYSLGLQSLTGRPEDELSATDNIGLSFEISSRIRLETVARQRLLAAPDAAARLRRCLALLHRELTLLRSTRSVPIAAQALQIVAVPN